MYKQYVSVQEALEIILAHADEPMIEVVKLEDCLGRVLAEDVVADSPIPSFHKSPLDGYAVRFIDVKDAKPDQPVTLEVIESVPAGHVPALEVIVGKATRIMTGAPLPQGADTIIKFEDTNVQKDQTQHYENSSQHVDIYHVPKSPGNYSHVGEDMEQGQLIVTKGRLIDAAVIAVLASFGYHEVHVYRKPNAIVFASGDELVSVDQQPSYGKLRNSNSPSITAQLIAWGVRAQMGGIVPDQKEQIASTLLAALDSHDFVVTTGGVSVGDYDVMKEVFQAIGAEILFWRVAMRPGTPMVVAKWKDKMIFGLSGNPSAAYISCELFVRAFVRKIQSLSDVWREPVRAMLTRSVGKVVGQDRFLRATASVSREGSLLVEPLATQKSGILSNLIDANCLIYVPASKQKIHSGDSVDVILLHPPTASNHELNRAKDIPLFGFAGFANSGKTTLVCKVIARLREMGYRVASVKHDGHSFQMDQEGKDTWKHRQAGSEAVTITSDSQLAFIDYRKYEREEQLKQALSHIRDVDIILIEGFKTLSIPKIYVVRNPDLLHHAYELPMVEAIATDFSLEQQKLPVYDINDVEGLSRYIVNRVLGES
ncbi:molybdopterin-guanine dinucleotide biosynthesis protein B [Desulfuribacillus stibiiarsenatis]|uniref:Molybdopterin molybdenumtransferase n=1 Tax=Desulfuribacillus stibiiarsenatis TaxID=1390249 RepID=A0A1E5L580_9FIRM|nr:gephyrin-like molybdotransferase Glp [Desulfuribacillus stibiiarsenatis]OEH85218.1 molybdopterin-guanine dinucleotide biosynthesis protein B [Desulfuribacillus stibiiarsenatis]